MYLSYAPYWLMLRFRRLPALQPPGKIVGDPSHGLESRNHRYEVYEPNFFSSQKYDRKKT